MRLTALLPIVVWILLAAPMAAAESDDPVAGTWALTGRNSRDGVYRGEMTITRSPRGYSVDARVTLADGTEENWGGTGTVAGRALEATLTRSGSGIVENLRDPRNPVTETLQARWLLSRSGARLNGSWTSSLDGIRSREWLRRTTPKVAIDLVLVRPGGVEVPEDVEATEGEAIAVNLDDDDGDGGTGGHGETTVVPDYADANGTARENDLVEVRVKEIVNAPAGSILRLEYDAERLGLYRGADRSGAAQDGVLELPAGPAARLYVEGRASTEAGAPALLTLTLRKGSETLGEDRVALHVAQNAFLMLGHGNSGRWTLDNHVRKNAKDARREPGIVPGKDRDGNTVYWAVWVGSSEKFAKQALNVPGAVIAYDGHSNFGMGFAFETHHRRVSEFMNIAPEQVPVNWHYLRDHQEHPELVFAESEYGDDATTPAFSDPVQQPISVRGVNGTYSTARFPLSPGRGGKRFTLTRGEKRLDDHHYDVGGRDNVRIVVKAGAADLPGKTWRAMFLNSCYSGPYYYTVFNHGTLFFTTDSASSARTSAAFLIGYIDGKKESEILKELNTHENVNDYVTFGQE